jgi:hypothetical protein
LRIALWSSLSFFNDGSKSGIVDITYNADDGVIDVFKAAKLDNNFNRITALYQVYQV